MPVNTGNTNSFEELDGSPSESYSGGRLSATRIFVGPSVDRFQFIRDVTSYVKLDVDETGSTYYPGIPYPDNESLVPTGWSIKNLGPPVHIADGLPVSNLTWPVRSECETGYECEITVNYESGGDQSGVNAKNHKDAPDPPNGTFLSVGQSFSLQEESIPIRGADAGADSTGFYTPEDEEGKTYVSVHEITFHWERVIRPNWDLIINYLGKLNYNEFWGYPRGAVIFEGFRHEAKLNIVGQWTYDIEFVFTAKTVPSRNYLIGSFAPLPVLVKNDRLGWYNRTWTPKPLPGTQQHWRLLRQADGPDAFANDMLTPTQYFEDLIAYAPYAPPPP